MSNRPEPVRPLTPDQVAAILDSTPGEGTQPSYTVRVGILRQRRDFVPKRQNWFRSALPWVTGLAAVHKNERQG